MVQHSLPLGVVRNQYTRASFHLAETTTFLKRDYRVFARGERLIFGRKSTNGKKYNKLYVIPPQTTRLLGKGAPAGYHKIIEEAIAASVSADTKSNYSTALNMLAACQATLNRSMSLPLSDQDVLCFVSFMAKSILYAFGC